jgi:hypothetical protein
MVRRERLLSCSRRPNARNVRHIVQQNREFIAPEPRDQVSFANDLGQSASHRQEQRIPGRMAKRIIDRLEAVEVEIQDSKLLAGSARSGKGMIEPIKERSTICEAGQDI